eukprot:c20061_g2_i1 orf=13-312(-)
MVILERLKARYGNKINVAISVSLVPLRGSPPAEVPFLPPADRLHCLVIFCQWKPTSSSTLCRCITRRFGWSYFFASHLQALNKNMTTYGFVKKFIEVYT